MNITLLLKDSPVAFPGVLRVKLRLLELLIAPDYELLFQFCCHVMHLQQVGKINHVIIYAVYSADLYYQDFVYEGRSGLNNCKHSRTSLASLSSTFLTLSSTFFDPFHCSIHCAFSAPKMNEPNNFSPFGCLYTHALLMKCLAHSLM